MISHTYLLLITKISVSSGAYISQLARAYSYLCMAMYTLMSYSKLLDFC